MQNTKSKIFFVHIPKTAGCSFREPLLHNQVGAPVAIFGHNIRRKKYKYFKDSKKPKKFSFTFVRNPWDRLVSAFKWLNSGGCNRYDRMDADKYLKGFRNDFTGFVRHFNTNDTILEQLHFKQQYKWICDDDDKILVDYIGKFENLQEDFNIICDKIGIPKQQLPHNNKTKHKHYTEYYDDASREIVAKIYTKDIEYFGYEFGE